MSDEDKAIERWFIEAFNSPEFQKQMAEEFKFRQLLREYGWVKLEFQETRLVIYNPSQSLYKED